MSTAGTVGEYGGRAAGGVLGGLIGSVFGPIGTWIGRAAGSRLGGLAGRAAGEALASYMEDANAEAEEKTREVADTNDCATGTCKPKDPCEHLRRGRGSGRYRGGAHGETKKPVGDQLDSHHMPAKDSFPKSDWEDLPAIQMDRADHQKTMSNGNKGRVGAQWRAKQAQLIRDGKFKEALQMDIDDARRIAKESGNPSKYDEAIKEAEEYAKCREKHGLNRPKSIDAPTVAPSAEPKSPGSESGSFKTPTS